MALISSLRKDDQVAVMQVNNRVELVHDWTVTQSEVIQSVDNKLLPGKRSALVAGLAEAVEQFRKVPAGNNHLVLVSDGVEPSDSHARLDHALKNLLGSNITVHIISYTLLGRKVKWVSPSRPREKSAVDKHLIEALPSGRFREDPTPDLKTAMQTKGGVVVDVDRLFPGRRMKETLKQREEDFVGITEETGGNVWLPTSAAEMIQQAAEVARDVDSHYVISYKPLQPLNSRTASEYRKIGVISRRVGLKVRARRGYIAKVPG